MSEDRRWPDDADNRRFSSAASSVPGFLLSGMLIYGGAGWLAGRWLDIPALLPVGLVIGLLLAMYLVYVRYGR